jgi:hypothetical protein
MQVGYKAQAEKAALATKTKLEGMKLGSNIARNKQQANDARQLNAIKIAADLKKHEDNLNQPSNKETK